LRIIWPGRVRSNSTVLVFSRDVSMYLARHVGRWRYPKISRFYNRRNYTTVIAAVRKIEQLRASDESVDDLIEMLTATLNGVRHCVRIVSSAERPLRVSPVPLGLRDANKPNRGSLSDWAGRMRRGRRTDVRKLLWPIDLLRSGLSTDHERRGILVVVKPGERHDVAGVRRGRVGTQLPDQPAHQFLGLFLLEPLPPK
jgi:hypothetical protein